jgi:hypothetical protein
MSKIELSSIRLSYESESRVHWRIGDGDDAITVRTSNIPGCGGTFTCLTHDRNDCPCAKAVEEFVRAGAL